MKVLVTGASGFVGSHMAEALLKAGHSVRGLSRQMPEGERRKPGVEYIPDLDIALSSTLTSQMFHEVDAIVHLVGIIQQGTGNQTFQRVHVDGTQNLVDAATDSGITSGRFVYMSAIGSSPDSPAEYSRTKYAAEQVVMKSGFPYTIFRPSLVLGRDGEFVKQMEDLVKHGGLPIPLPFPFIPVPGPGLNKFQPIDVDDLCACVVRCLNDRRTVGKVYEVGGATQVTFNLLLEGFAGRMGVKKPLLHAPIPALGVAATVMEALMPKPPVTRDQLANLGRDNVTNSRAIEEVFGINPLAFPQILTKIYGN
ncbi:MAG: NAD-dependent epimerase/dehydratase family protein [Armatimonadetes bacterium]|nr:NAD-dependent epimerase/dehydratase family protein [Armatimonadota bacterium]